MNGQGGFEGDGQGSSNGYGSAIQGMGNQLPQFFQNPQFGQWMGSALSAFNSMLGNIQRQFGSGMNSINGPQGNPFAGMPQGILNTIQGLGGQVGQTLGQGLNGQILGQGMVSQVGQTLGQGLGGQAGQQFGQGFQSLLPRPNPVGSGVSNQVGVGPTSLSSSSLPGSSQGSQRESNEN